MSSDDDKTVFRSKVPLDGDRTVIRPRPGGRGGGAQQAPPVQQQPYAQPASPQPQAYQASPQVDVETACFRTTYGLNPLVNAASTLIAVFESTRRVMNHSDVSGLHQRLVNEVKAFELRIQALGLKPEIVLSVRYALCSALDEVVLNTPWGAESPWAQRTLLAVFHNETSGGEKFFQILERMRQMPTENIDVLELMYILLSLGFEGRYRLVNRGRDALEQIRDDLFALIRSHRGEYERTLSPAWQGLGKIRNTLAEYIPMWVVASMVGAVLFVSYSGFRYCLYRSSSPVAAQLTEIAEIGMIKKTNSVKLPD